MKELRLGLTHTIARAAVRADGPVPPGAERTEQEREAQRGNLRPEPKVRSCATCSDKVTALTRPFSGLRPEPLHNWFLPFAPAPYHLHVPTNPIPYIVAPMAIVIGLASLYTLRPVLVPVLQSRLVWGAASMILILTFTSGYMWNKIKNAPYVAAGEGGRVNWIAGGFQNQFVLESQVVGGLCALRLPVIARSPHAVFASSPLLIWPAGLRQR